MKDSIEIGYNVETNEPVSIDLEYLIDQKVQILGNSRSGKSRGGRILAENSNGKIHQIIISPKKEFVTLREKFDYIHVGRASDLSKPDIEINTRYAEQLALDIMKIGMDVVIEFSEAPKERIQFVKNFIDGLMMVPQKYWHPTMVMIDEIDIWAPEKGHGEAISLGSLVDLAARGADKGYSLVAITQKLAKFNKDVASELNIKLIGNVSLDTDQIRACQELGIERRNKKVLATLGKPNYHFFAYGPGISDEVIKMKFHNPSTTHIPGWKLNKNLKPIPTPDKVKKLLTEFSNLEVEAEKEIKTKDDLKAKITMLENKLKTTNSTNPQQEKQIQLLTKDNTQKTKYLQDMTMKLKELNEYTDGLEEMIHRTVANLSIVQNRPDHDPINFSEIKIASLASVHTTSKGFIASQPISVGDAVKVDDLSEGPNKMLNAIAMFDPETCNSSQVGLISKYTPGGGTFANYQRELKRKGLVEGKGKTFQLTELGRSITSGVPKVPKNTPDVLAFWGNYLGSGPFKMLKFIVELNVGVDYETIGEHTDFTPGGGTFNNYLRELKRLELITVNNKIARPSKRFFSEVYV